MDIADNSSNLNQVSDDSAPSSTSPPLMENIMTVSGIYYDGISAIPHDAQLSIADNKVFIESATLQTNQQYKQYIESIKIVNFGDATQHGIRLISFENNAQFQAHDIQFLNNYLKQYSIGQMKYSRNHESEADEAAIRIMYAAKINPAELAEFFERVEKSVDSKKPQANKPLDFLYTVIPDILSSHPNSAERMARLRNTSNTSNINK